MKRPSFPDIMPMFLAVLLVLGCRKEVVKEVRQDDIMRIPAGFPPMHMPDDNRFTTERWQLGKRLFYEKALSRNRTVSCASCHHPQLAFSDSTAFSKGDQGAAGTSNAPTLSNIGYHPYLTRAGSVPTIEMQVLVPVQEHNEFNTHVPDIVARLATDTSYQRMAQQAYGRAMDAFVLTRALACFERSIISGNSAYDQYYFQGKATAMNDLQLQGKELFFSEKTNCTACHSGFNFTNYSFENNGLYTSYADSGRMRFTRTEADRARFKVPTLRNIAFTAPYMHDGSIASLDEVVEHYNRGGVAHPNKNALIRPLQLSNEEKKALVAFLHALSDYDFIKNKHLKNEE